MNVHMQPFNFQFAAVFYRSHQAFNSGAEGLKVRIFQHVLWWIFIEEKDIAVKDISFSVAMLKL